MAYHAAGLSGEARQALPLEPKSLVFRGSGVMHAPIDNIEI